MKWAITLVTLAVALFVAGFAAYRLGKASGVVEGRAEERRRWEDAAGTAPYLRETDHGRFYYVRWWHGKKPIPDFGILE